MTTPGRAPIKTFTEALDVLAAIDTQSIRYEVRKLAAIRAWAMRQLGVDYEVGDRVEFTTAPRTDNGWHAYRECLVVGATAVVTGIDFNEPHDYWFADIVLDREWSVGSPFPDGRVTRWWNGPPGELPDGFEQARLGRERKHTFAMPVEYLTKADP